MKRFPRAFARKPLAMISLGYVLVIIVAAVFANVLAPYGPDDQDLTHSLSGPSSAHWLGTSELGRDVLSYIMYGGRVTLLGVLITLVVFLLIGVPAGMLAGYRGGWFDRLVLKLSYMVFAVPAMIVLLVVLAIFPGNEAAAMAANGLLGAPQLARVVRSATLGAREELFVRAAAVAGLRDRVIIRRHVLPRVTGPIVVQATIYGAAAVLVETGLGFLGVGTQSASWGNLVAQASQNIGTDPWLLVPSGGIIITFILAWGLLGDGIRDALVERTRAPRPKTTAIITTSPGLPATPGSLLSVRGLSVAIEGTEVIKDVSFAIRPGEAFGIVGESGCGKTITATAVLGLLPEGGQVSAGSIWFDGVDLAHAREAELRKVRGRRIGWISQDPIASLDPSFTVGSQVAEAVRVHTGLSRRRARQRVLELLTMLKLPDPERVARSYPHQLSGGMAQRVGIAAALAGDPALIIADEPTTALDVTVQAEILDLLRELRRAGTSIILITHDWGVLAEMCQRAVVMYAGQVVEVATVASMVSEPAHPYTAGLLRSDPHHGVPGQPLPALDGVVPAPSRWPAGCHFADRCQLAADACRAAPVDITILPGGERETRCIKASEVVAHG